MPELTTSQSILLTDLALCVNHYRLYTPGIYVCLHVPVRLDAQNTIVPGLIAMINHGRLQQCEPEERGYEGPPNFVLDVLAADDLTEYERRRGLFERFGVTEYVAVEDADSPVLHWNRLDNGRFRTVESDVPGMIRSLTLPGLWMPPDALAKRDWWTIIAAIKRGVTRLGHHEFQETIWHKSGRPSPEVPIPFDAG